MGRCGGGGVGGGGGWLEGGFHFDSVANMGGWTGWEEWKHPSTTFP